MRNRITYLLACLIVSGSSLAQSVYKDNSYSPAERAEDLVKQLTPVSYTHLTLPTT